MNLPHSLSNLLQKLQLTLTNPKLINMKNNYEILTEITMSVTMWEMWYLSDTFALKQFSTTEKK